MNPSYIISACQRPKSPEYEVVRRHVCEQWLGWHDVRRDSMTKLVGIPRLGTRAPVDLRLPSLMPQSDDKRAGGFWLIVDEAELRPKEVQAFFWSQVTARFGLLADIAKISTADLVRAAALTCAAIERGEIK